MWLMMSESEVKAAVCALSARDSADQQWLVVVLPTVLFQKQTWKQHDFSDEDHVEALSTLNSCKSLL